MINTMFEIEIRMEKYMRQLRDLERQINLKMNHLCCLKRGNDQYCTISNLTDRKVNARLYVPIIDLEREIDMYIDRLVDVKKEMQQIISCVDEPETRDELGRRYSKFLRCE